MHKKSISFSSFLQKLFLISMLIYMVILSINLSAQDNQTNTKPTVTAGEATQIPPPTH